MSERGKSKAFYTSTGSNVTVKAAPGSIYGLNVMPGHGGIVVLVDSNGADGNLGATPDLNSDSITGLIGRIGPWSTSSNGTSPNPDLIAFRGLGFNAGLSLAATSNTRLIVEYE